ncbi:MAG: hypothetical protein AAGJ08_13690 [Cyanobacteria bacterium P01_H01_bin.35]
MSYWIKCLGVITTALVLSFPTIEELPQGGKLKNSPAFAQDISYSQSNSQSKIEIDRLLKEGAAYYQDWEFEKALEKFQQVLKLRREMGNLEAEARALFYVGATYNKLQEGETADDYYWEVMGVAEEARSQQEFEKISKYLCKNQEGRQYLQRQKFFYNQKLNIHTYCQGIPWEGDSGSVTLLMDEDEKEE